MFFRDYYNNILWGEESQYPLLPKSKEVIVPSSPEFIATSVPATDQYCFPTAEEQPLEVQPYSTAPVVKQAGPVVQEAGIFTSNIFGIPTLYLGIGAAVLLVLILLLRKEGN